MLRQISFLVHQVQSCLNPFRTASHRTLNPLLLAPNMPCCQIQDLFINTLGVDMFVLHCQLAIFPIDEELHLLQPILIENQDDKGKLRLGIRLHIL